MSTATSALVGDRAQVRVRGRVQELHRDPHAVAPRRHRDRPRHDPLHTQLRRDLGKELVRGAIPLHRGSRHDPERGEFAEQRDDLLVQLPHKEILTPGKVREWKNRDRGDGRVHVRNGQRLHLRRRRSGPLPIAPGPRVPLEPEHPESGGDDRNDKQRDARYDGDAAGGPFVRPLQPFRCQVVDPRERQNDRQPQQQHDNQGLQHPIRGIEGGEHDFAQLQRDEGRDDVIAAAAHHAPAAQFLPECPKASLPAHMPWLPASCDGPATLIMDR